MIGQNILGLSAALLLLAPAHAMAAEGFQWARHDGGTGADTACSVAVDSKGNIVIAGTFTGTATFGAQGTLTAAGTDIYVAKLDTLGNFIWVKQIGGTGTDTVYGPDAVAIGPSDSIYLTGRFTGGSFSVAGSSTLAPGGSSDIFIAKLDASGAPQWVNHPASAAGVISRSKGICVDASGNCYVTGNIGGSTSFPTTPTATVLAPGSQQIFVCKVDGSGATQWAVRCGGTGVDDASGIALAPGGGDPYIVGSTNSNNFSFPPILGTQGTAGSTDIVLAKLNGTNGNFVYGTLAGGSGADVGYGICVDSSGQAYITGSFTGTATFPGTTPATASASGGGLDCFVAQMDAAGDNFPLVTSGGANGQDDIGHQVALDGAGNLVVVGDHSNNASFGALPPLTSAGGLDAFVARLNPTTGTWLVAATGGSSGADSGEAGAVSGTVVILSGEYSNTATFGVNPTLANAGSTDGFIAEFGPVAAGVTILETGGSTQVTEGGATDTYFVALNSQPTASVTITPTPDSFSTVSPTFLTFTTANWSVPQVVTVTAFDDSIAQGTHTSTITHAAASGDAGYAGIAIANVVATVTDNDTVGVTVSKGAVNVTEGGATDTYTLVLTSQPLASVTVTPASTNGYVTLSSPVIFTVGNWNVAQTVTVTAFDDQIAQGLHTDTITHSITAPGDASYAAYVPASVTANVTDNDVASIVITGTAAVSEAGATSATVQVHLSSQPTANVTVTPTSTDTVTGVTVTTGALTFTSGNWSTDQAVTVQAIDDLVAEGTQIVNVNLTPTGGDPVYSALAAKVLPVTVTDNDTAGIQAVGLFPATLDEGDPTSSKTLNVTLESQPDAGKSVVIDLTTDTVQGVNVSSNQLTFTDLNWNVAQPVTVTPVYDNIQETSPSTATVTLAVNTTLTTAPEYLTVGNATASYNVLDDDRAAVQITANQHDAAWLQGTQGGGTSHTCVADAQGNVYVAGYMSQALTIGGTTLPLIGSLDIFLAKFQPDGTLAWARNLGLAAQQERIIALALDRDGNVYATGQFQGALVFAPLGVVTPYNLTGWDAFVAKFDPTNGNCLWINHAGSALGNTVGWGLAVDTKGGVYMTGSQNGATSFPGIGADTQIGGQDAFLAKLDQATGTFQWALVGGGAGSDGGLDVAVDRHNNVFWAGMYNSSGATNPATFGSVTLPAVPYSAFLIEVTPGGTIVQGNAAGNGGHLVQAGLLPTLSVAADDNGHAYLAGAYTGTPGFSALTAPAISGTQSGFLATYDTATNTFTALNTFDTTGSTTLGRVRSDGAGRLFLAGEFTTNLTVPGMGTVAAGGNEDAFALTYTIGTGFTELLRVNDPGATMEGNEVAVDRLGDEFLTGEFVTQVNAGRAGSASNGGTASPYLVKFEPEVKTAEGGATDSFQVVLSSQPTVNVTVNLATDGHQTLSVPSVTFTAGNWNTPQPVTVTAFDDAIAQGSPHYGFVTGTISTADPVYSPLGVASVIDSITDNDTPGISTTESGGSTNVSETGATTDTYTVVLLSQPIADVTVTLTNDPTHVTVSAPTLTFTSANWNTPQTVTVTAVDDHIIEAGVFTSTITQAATSTDPNYNGIAVASVVVNITNTDAAGVTVTESGGSTDVTEGGATDTYTLVLTAQPTAPVTVFLTADSYVTVNTPSVTFPAAQWNVPQTITVTAVNDLIEEGPHLGVITHSTASLDPNFNGLAVAQVNCNVTDNDVAAVVVTQSGGSTDVTEGGATDTFTVVLATQPAQPVTVDITTDGQTTVNLPTLNFDNTNWNLPQTVTVTAFDDNIQEISPRPSTITLSNSSTDPFYNAANIIQVDGTTTDTITAHVTDNDIAAVVVVESGGSTDVTEGGATDTYTVQLATQPTADVVVTVTPDGYTTVAPSPLTFTAATWNVPQTVTVTAFDDNIAEGLHNSTIAHTAASLDPFYNGIAIPNVIAHVTDNDFPAVVITESGSSTDVTEGGATDTYTLQLATQPTAPVTITITCDAQVTVDKPTVTFDGTNWNVPQTITVTAVDDLIAEPSPSPGVITQTASSTDPFYNGLAVGQVVANVTDNDTAGVLIVQSGGSTDVVEGGATDSFTVTLESQPTAPVTVTFTPDAQTTVSPSFLTFDASNWTTPQTVTVTGVLELPTIVTGANPPPEQPIHPGLIVGTTASTDPFYNILGYYGAGIFQVDGAPGNVVTANVSDTSVRVLSPGFGQTAFIDATVGTGIVRAAGVVTVTTLTPHLLTPGQVIVVSGVDDASFDGSFAVTGVLSPTQFTYAQPSQPDANSEAGAEALSSPEVWNVGSTQNVNWNALRAVANVDVQYSATGTFTDTVDLGTYPASANPLAITVPNTPTAAGKIRVIDAAQAQVYGESAPFSVVVPSLQVLSPNGGETFNMDDPTTVQWSSVGNIPTVDIQVSSQKSVAIASNGLVRVSGVTTVTTVTNHGYTAGDQVIISGAGNTSFDGVFSITGTTPTAFTFNQTALPDTVATGGQALVLRWVAIPGLTGIPNTGTALWNVETPGVAIASTARNTNLVTVTTATPVDLTVGDSLLIKGVADASFDGTQTVTAVISATQFSYLQTGPNASSSGGTLHQSSQTVRVRVVDPSQTSLNGYSAGDFSVFNPGIFMTTPNGGEIINRNSNFLIQWLTVPSAASIPLVDIDVSTDNGLTWTPALDNAANPATGIPNTGSFLWDVTQAATQTAKVRVSNHAGGLGIGISVSPFTILGVFNVDQTLVTLDPVVKSSGFDPDLTPVATFTLTTEEDWEIDDIDPLTSQFSNYPWLQVREIDATHPFYGAAPGQGTVGVSNPLYAASAGPSYVLGSIATATGAGAARVSNVVTITTATAHGFKVGDRVYISGVDDTSFDSAAGAWFTVASVPSATTFTYAQTGPDGTSEAGTAAVYPHDTVAGQQTITFQVAMDPGNLPEGDYVGLIRLRGLNTNSERLVVVRGTVTDAFRVHVPVINKDLISTDFQGTVKYSALQNFRGTLPPFEAVVENLSKVDTVTYSTNATTNTLGKNWLDVESAGSGWVTSLPNQTAFPAPLNILTANGAVRLGGSVTISTVAAHNYTIGDTVTIAGVSDPSFDGTFTIGAVASTSFSYVQAGPDANAGGGTASIGVDSVSTEIRIDQSQMPTAPGVYTGQVIFSSITGETRVIIVELTIVATSPTAKRSSSGCNIGVADTDSTLFVFMLLGLIAALSAWRARHN
ncbi:MAG: hypothetical protein ACREJ2_14865 [Planctomycetota bacterium]